MSVCWLFTLLFFKFCFIVNFFGFIGFSFFLGDGKYFWFSFLFVDFVCVLEFYKFLVGGRKFFWCGDMFFF